MIAESFRDWGRDCWCDSGCDNTCGKRYGWQLGELPAGYDHKYTYAHLGYNLKATDLQTSVGIEQLKKLEGFRRKRIKNFHRLKNQLQDLEEAFILPAATPDSDPNWFGFILTVRDASLDRNAITQFLEGKGIQTRMLFGGNMIKQPAYAEVKYRIVDTLTNTDKIMHDTCLVGVYPGLTNDMIDYMSEMMHKAIR